MKILLLTKEYPPEVYGGAGVHIEYLSRELAALDGGAHQVEVLTFGSQRLFTENLRVEGVGKPFDVPVPPVPGGDLLDIFFRGLLMAGRSGDADVIHCHTWYTHLAGFLAKKLFGAPLILTTHSLEPSRPWKAEQLGPGYDLSTWIEGTAYRAADGIIAVSGAMKQDVASFYGVPPERARVIYNGIDTEEYRYRSDPELLRHYVINPSVPYVLFVGRITRQKGITHMLRAAKYMKPGLQVVLCAGAPDTPAIKEEMETLLDEVRREAPGEIIWIPHMLTREHLITLYSHAAVFVCPSVYEPFGFINIEAMACGTPVVASKVGGIPEIILDGETGVLVPLEPAGPGDPEPARPEAFARALAAAVNELLASPQRLREMGRRARERAVAEFSWPVIARQTLEYYKEMAAAVK